jgi:alkanesulfonate monooxygenase SsuD/methylene tetrahydromethanopterin reductase-like flavin-dependent oxidoreductase (luciferase family)
LAFGYNPPTGQRGLETVTPETFFEDLEKVLDFAAPHFSSFWVSDHLAVGDTYRLECWTLLTWMATKYPDQLVGTNVMANSFRLPQVLAKMAITLQELSKGRLILGYGAGWVEAEYRGYGIPFPSAKVRTAEMSDGIKAMRSLWTSSPATYDGVYYTLTDAISNPLPKTVPPILIGGEGERYLLRAVAEHADYWLPSSRNPAVIAKKKDVLLRHCEDVGRDPASIKTTITLPVFLRRSHEEAVEWAGARLNGDNPPFAGTPAELGERLEQYVDLGLYGVQLVFPGYPETDDMQLFAEEVLPAFS